MVKESLLSYILVDNLGVMHFIEKILFAMFGFFPSSIHIFMDVACDDKTKSQMKFTGFWSLEVKDCIGWLL